MFLDECNSRGCWVAGFDRWRFVMIVKWPAPTKSGRRQKLSIASSCRAIQKVVDLHLMVCSCLCVCELAVYTEIKSILFYLHFYLHVNWKGNKSSAFIHCSASHVGCVWVFLCALNGVSIGFRPTFFVSDIQISGHIDLEPLNFGWPRERGASVDSTDFSY